MFGPTGLLPGQSHTPTRIGRDLHELVAQHDQERQAGECCLWKLCQSAIGRDLHELIAQHDQERQAGECCLQKLS